MNGFGILYLEDFVLVLLPVGSFLSCEILFLPLLFFLFLFVFSQFVICFSLAFI